MHRREFLLRSGLLAGGLVCPAAFAGEAAGRATRAATGGPLRVHPGNPRYFADAAGRAVYLTGSHTWNSLSDIGTDDPPARFDFAGYLDFLDAHHHNFIRLWRWELCRWDFGATPEFADHGRRFTIAPHPWPRTGPGLAADGAPRFDLSRLDPVYFARLRERLAAARKRGMYVGIMLFEGWGLQHVPDAWQWHPFHPANNIQGIDGDAGGDGRGLRCHTLASPAVTRLQEAYVRQVVDVANGFDNALYEISNETGSYSIDWQYHMIRFIREVQAEMPRRHPVGMTFPHSNDAAMRGSNRDLYDSPADWISPDADGGDGHDFRDNPPPADGRKVVLVDTDHLWGIGGGPDWVWKTFLRGHHPLFMDPYDNRVAGKGDPASWNPARRAMGNTRRLAQRVDLATMTPAGRLVSSGYCLARPGRRYLAYLPAGGSVRIDLRDAPGAWTVEWIHPLTGRSRPLAVVAGGAQRHLRAPFAGPAALLLSPA